MSRRKKKFSNGSGKGGLSNMGQWAGFLSIVFGVVSLYICLIMFNIGIDALDDAVTAAATYTEQVGLGDIMGVWGMVIFLLFMALGLAGLATGAVINIRKAQGSWMEVFMVVIMGGVTLVIALLMNTTIQGGLHTAYVTANATVNKADFVGLLEIMTIWGMVIFLALMGAGVSQIAGAAVSGFKKVRGMM